jgi:hypothetical protein
MNNLICKAKDIETNTWVQGYYVSKVDPLYGFPYHYLLYQGHDKHNIPDSFLTWHKIDPDTVCRYTGLNDKHNNPIFENDVVMIDDGFDKFAGCVRWDQACAFYEIEYGTPLYFYEALEVIGNKFDNTNLMED